MTTYNSTDFLRFSAYSFKELITRKLTEDSRFTDQVYEGSNLAVLIDIFSHMALCLTYALNKTAAESMFSDTLIYENMNRLIKFIDYHPAGIGNRTMNFSIDKNTYNHEVLKKYSSIDTNLTDVNGKKIIYSLIEDKTVNSTEPYEITLYNGKWKLYNTVFTSSGEPYLKFVLNSLKSDSTDTSGTLVASNMIHVYVDEDNFRGYTNKLLIQYNCVTTGIFSDSSKGIAGSIYKSNDKIFDLRLNENKAYEITFGNGQLGKIPPKNTSIYVMYLDTNGEYDTIPLNILTNLLLKHSSSLLGLSLTLYRGIFGCDSATSPIYSCNLWKNSSNSVEFTSEETVDEIRRNSPVWFKTGNRLVTVSDYEYFFKNKYSDLIQDVVCQNNYTYITSFYRWLYNLGNVGLLKMFGYRKKTDNPCTYYLNLNRMIKYDYRWADSADSNNVYVWIKMKNNSDMLKTSFNNEIENIKDITQDVVYVEPINVLFDICAETPDTAIKYFVEENGTFDPKNYNYLEITLDDNCLYTNIDITTTIASILQEFFDEAKLKLGQEVNYSLISELIYAIGSVSKIRTVYHNDETGEIIVKPGVSFATWSTDFIDSGDDLDVSTTVKLLEPFLFPLLYNSNNIEQKIKIIRKTVNNLNSVTY